MLYSGHEEGALESQALLSHARKAPQSSWSVYHHSWLNQRSKRTGTPAPSLLLLQRLHDAAQDKERSEGAC
eukprot:710851-Pleurochrysis_carterae.AAC.1